MSNFNPHVESAQVSNYNVLRAKNDEFKSQKFKTKCNETFEKRKHEIRDIRECFRTFVLCLSQLQM